MPLEPYPEGYLTASLLAAGPMPLILDNVTDLVLPIGDRKDFTPIASFDNTTIWRGFTSVVLILNGFLQALDFLLSFAREHMVYGLFAVILLWSLTYINR